MVAVLVRQTGVRKNKKYLVSNERAENMQC